MTTYVAFQPATKGPPFRFQAALDGATHTIAVWWNFAAQRWYISITDQLGTLVVNRPMVGSPVLIALAGLSWANGMATATAPSYMGFKTGSLASLTVTGAAPAALSGTFPCTIIGPAQFSYPVAQNPGPVTAFGSWSADQNLAGGWFTTSTLVWRPSTGNFEVNP